MKCPKCSSTQITSFGWELNIEKQYYMDGEINETKFVECVAFGTDPDSDTSCDECDYQAEASEFSSECETHIEFMTRKSEQP